MENKIRSTLAAKFYLTPSQTRTVSERGWFPVHSHMYRSMSLIQTIVWTTKEELKNEKNKV